MDNFGQFHRTREKLSANFENWKRLCGAPSWAKDCYIAVDRYVGPKDRWELIEALTATSVSTGQSSRELAISLLLNCYTNSEVELDQGFGHFYRPSRPGSIVFCNTSIPFRYQGQGPFHSMVLFLKLDDIASRLADLADRPLSALEYLHSKSFRDDEIESILKQLLHQCRHDQHHLKEFESEVLIDRLCRRMLQLTDHFTPQISPEDTLQPASIRRVIDFLHENYHKSLTLSEIAMIAGVSRCHLSRLFRQSTGKTLERYLVGIRVEKAKQIIRNSIDDIPLTTIASACGFYDRSHLSRAFRQHVGVSPLQFRDSR